MTAMEGDAPATTVHIAGIELPDEDVTFNEPDVPAHLLLIVGGCSTFVGSSPSSPPSGRRRPARPN